MCNMIPEPPGKRVTGITGAGHDGEVPGAVPHEKPPAKGRGAGERARHFTPASGGQEITFFPALPPAKRTEGIFSSISLANVSTGHLAHSADTWTMFWKIRVPAALPELFVGLKGAAVNATVGATIAEWVGGDAGLGYYIQIATGQLRMDLAYAIIFMLATVGLLLFYIVVVLERRIIPWHVSQRAPVVGPTGL
jgi:hypothetical protein